MENNNGASRFHHFVTFFASLRCSLVVFIPSHHLLTFLSEAPWLYSLAPKGKEWQQTHTKNSIIFASAVRKIILNMGIGFNPESQLVHPWSEPLTSSTENRPTWHHCSPTSVLAHGWKPTPHSLLGWNELCLLGVVPHSICILGLCVHHFHSCLWPGTQTPALTPSVLLLGGGYTPIDQRLQPRNMLTTAKKENTSRGQGLCR